MYTVFICRKCGHHLYVNEVDDFGKKLEEIADKDCPECGEEAYENWLLGFRTEEFPEEV